MEEFWTVYKTAAIQVEIVSRYTIRNHNHIHTINPDKLNLIEVFSCNFKCGREKLIY